MTYEKGTRIRVDLTARVQSSVSADPALLGTSRVSEINEKSTNTGFSHFLYLISTNVTGDLRLIGGEVKAAFDAEVTGKYMGSKYSTT